MLPVADADAAGVTPGWDAEAFPGLSRFGKAPPGVSPPLAGDVSVATDELGAGAAVPWSVTDGATAALGVGGGAAFSAPPGLIAGDVIGTVACFSNCRVALLSFPRSRAVGEPGVVVLVGGALASGSPTAPRFDGEVAGGAVAVARGALVKPGVEVGVAIGVATTPGVKVRCGIAVDVSAALGVDVGTGVSVAVATAAGVVSALRTNFFGGASCGGVASACILARACSASR